MCLPPEALFASPEALRSVEGSVEGEPIGVTCRPEMRSVGHCGQALLPHTALPHSNRIFASPALFSPKVSYGYPAGTGHSSANSPYKGKRQAHAIGVTWNAY